MCTGTYVLALIEEDGSLVDNQKTWYCAVGMVKHEAEIVKRTARGLIPKVNAITLPLQP
jgi:hypothetical protein